MRIQQPLLLIGKRGRLLRRDLVTGADTELSAHGFESAPNVVRSADGRWLCYHGELAGLQRQQYWLYDLQTGQDRLALEAPAWGGAIPAFSPDGRHLAIALNYDSRWPDAAMAGTYVFDTPTLQVTRLGIPAAAPAEAAWTVLRWSADGSRLLLVTIDHRGNAPLAREYRTWVLGASVAMATEGRWVEDLASAAGHDAWLLNGAEVAIFEQRQMEGQNSGVPPSSPDGTWTVKVVEQDGEAALEVVDKSGKVRRADSGPYDQCEGYAISLIGWLDTGHLVYRKPGFVTRVLEVATGRVAPLLKPGDDPYLFGW